MRPSLSLFVGLLLCSSLHAETPIQRPQQALVASAHPAATVAGLETLAAGGNAFDAAVAVAAALAVAEPYGSGLGGGGFFLLREAGTTPRYRFVDARERAPLKAHAGMYAAAGKTGQAPSLDGALAAAIPGLPAALAHLSQRYGKLALRDSLYPAQRLARDGIGIDTMYRERVSWRLKAMQADPETARIFLSDNQAPAEHSLLRQPELASTLQRLADHGHAGFYSGRTADLLVRAVQAAGGIWTHKDLADYRVIERQPLRARLQEGRELITAPPPSAGGVALIQSLAMLQQLNWRNADTLTREHLVIESLRRAYRDRGLLGDPDQVRNPLASLLAPAYLQQLARSIDRQKATPSSSLPAATAWHEGPHTTHFTVIDQAGNAVSATLSINLPFGAAFTAKGSGVLLNNEMDDFAKAVDEQNAYGLTGSQANLIAPGERPLSSMTPSFVESAGELSSFGTPGGSRIPSMVLLGILEYLDGQPIERWAARPRFHHQYLPDVLEYEPATFSSQEKAGLLRLGHQLQSTNRRYGNLQVLRWNKLSGAVEGASDPRGLGRTDTIALPPQ